MLGKNRDDLFSEDQLELARKIHEGLADVAQAIEAQTAADRFAAREALWRVWRLNGFVAKAGSLYPVE
ncbi:hypothetical protein, partial [Mesorhizobium tianshanense]